MKEHQHLNIYFFTVLGHQSQVSEAQTLPTQSGEEISHAGRCRNVNERRKEDLTRNFNKVLRIFVVCMSIALLCV